MITNMIKVFFMPSTTTIKKEQIGDVVVLKIVGPIILKDNSSIELRGAIETENKKGHSKIVVDLSNVPYVDEHGIGELVSAFSAAGNKGGKLVIVNPNARVRDSLEITGLYHLFNSFPATIDAVQSFEEPNMSSAAAPAAAPAPGGTSGMG